ncbi:flavin reductase family protein [Corynebacterium anserum]|uniref:flavin reductase family protein n=1 Tax=Corynebacterium anserum TaxID=2684406 RepID=UPI001FE55D7C|nr:flavin reductase family protein [Corynebacterium anserum]
MNQSLPQHDDLPRAFRNVFRGHPAGVTLITATVDGKPVGITATSVSSLSLDPLAVSFSFMKSTGSAHALLRAESLLIHFLSDQHAHVAASFATSGSDRFSPEQGWVTAITGEPYLPGSRAVLRVRILDTAKSGDATLVAAEVTEVHNLKEASALVYQGHRFYSIENARPLASENPKPLRSD